MSQPPQSDAAFFADVGVRRQPIERRYVVSRQSQRAGAFGLRAKQFVDRLGGVEQHVDRSGVGGNEQDRPIDGALQQHGKDSLRGEVGTAD